MLPRGGASRPGAVMLLLRQGSELVSAATKCPGGGFGSFCADKVFPGAGSFCADRVFSAAGSVCAIKVFSGAGSVRTDQIRSGASFVDAKVSSGARYGCNGNICFGVGYGCNGGMALSKGRSWAAGITSRAFSTEAGLLAGIKLDSLTENQLYLIQAIEEVRREASQQFLEVTRGQLQLADELDKFKALERDAISESSREMVTVITLGGLGVGLIFIGMKDSSSDSSGGSALSTPSGAAPSSFAAVSTSGSAGGSGSSAPGASATLVTPGG